MIRDDVILLTESLLYLLSDIKTDEPLAAVSIITKNIFQKFPITFITFRQLLNPYLLEFFNTFYSKIYKKQVVYSDSSFVVSDLGLFERMPSTIVVPCDEEELEPEDLNLLKIV